ncbi:STY4534 family ICE replication protein [Methylotuvimicrobium sp. KM1]|uniref:STY4534 family ICE replication protein n=1 Tax=Methylotuvimicrobium sp. KM1 TaxID=3377707 RepID=UPI0038502202
MSESTQNPTHYFDLHVQGVGYVNRIREVPVKRGENFWACDIAALHGAEDAIEYTRFDCRVSGSEAAKLIKRLDKACRDKKKILIGFKLGDLYAETFVYEKGDKAGQTGVSLKARLLYISWIKVDGESVYIAPPKQEGSQEDSHEDCQADIHEDSMETEASTSA